PPHAWLETSGLPRQATVNREHPSARSSFAGLPRSTPDRPYSKLPLRWRPACTKSWPQHSLEAPGSVLVRHRSVLRNVRERRRLPKTRHRYSTAVLSRFVEKGVSRRATFRGRWRNDGKFTLVTVDFRNLTEHVIRLAESFHQHVEPGGRVIVVQNGSRANNR